MQGRENETATWNVQRYGPTIHVLLSVVAVFICLTCFISSFFSCVFTFFFYFFFWLIAATDGSAGAAANEAEAPWETAHPVLELRAGDPPAPLEWTQAEATVPVPGLRLAAGGYGSSADAVGFIFV